MMEYRRFESFCNSSTTGYLKPWKSFSLWHALEEAMPNIKEDSVRLREYLTSCLVMEGFRPHEIEEIATYVELDGKI